MAPDEAAAGSVTADAFAPVTVESVDGRAFVCRGDGSSVPRVGDYVEITVGTVRFVGQVEAAAPDAVGGGYTASGTLVGPDDAVPALQPTPAFLAPAEARSVAAVVSGPDPRLHLGHLAAMPEVGVGLVAKKLNRHTFWCGQSGSGKTYALGVALERILTATRLPVVVLDPNSDFVNLDKTVAEADAAEAAALHRRDVVVLRPDSAEHPLRIRFTDLGARSKAAVLRLDPITDRAEYNALIKLPPDFARQEAAEIVPLLRELGTPEAVLLAQRIENLGLLEWATVWAGHALSATEIVDRGPAATVLDLGGYDSQEEQLAIALGVLDHLWERRAERRPVLLVIDEAHNLCPPEPETPLGVAVRDRLVQIAAEGRKYGLWLLVSTQRPSKVHQGVVSQCDNVTLMRMNSRADLEELGRTFGFVPEDLLARAAHFGIGEALVAGGFVPRPAVVKMRDRVTVQGGTDVAVPMPADT